jgi:hypothetical protein
MVDGDETLSATDLSRTTASPSCRPGDEELPPTVLIDRYQIERRLGAGGMGVVYAARDVHLGRTVAVKLVGSRIDPGSGQGRLVREAQAMAKLRHPNIATFYDIGVSDDRLFVVMELIDGGTVVDWLKAELRSWREIVGESAGGERPGGMSSASYIGTSSRRTSYSAGTAGTPLDFPRWHPHGTLLAMASGNGERGIVRVRDAGNIESVAVVRRATTLDHGAKVRGDVRRQDRCHPDDGISPDPLVSPPVAILIRACGGTRAGPGPQRR